MNDATTTKTFAATPFGDCSGSTFEYEVTYTPSSNTLNLITLPVSTDASIIFTQSTNIADAQVYTVTVKARTSGSTTWTSPSGIATATYTYKNPCTTTTLIPPTLTSMETSVLK